ncbi:VOC family protein [Streptomyces sp. NBC_00075]|uniref:2-oxoadipate dioxygenase/decarboxylase n=1 Tax=Streptomyces sp. NBC_00093 TaxID=2975649 RepID=A0AAU1ZVU4_9ACTN
MRFVDSTELRAGFAARLSTLYGTEVPAYTTLVDVSHEVNQRVMRRDPEAAQRLGTIARVTAERHGAIRVGSPAELAQVARIFGALGMYPTGFYDLRDARPRPIPVISTAFRPTDRAELARNPFRVFTSMLVPEDGRFFDTDLAQRLRTFVGGRRLFGDELLTLADHAEAEGGLKETDAERFLTLATAAFALSPEPVDRAWYSELERVSDVAADIGGVTSTHINHLTPRVLDIDDLYADMSSRGIAMIDRIQGPPRWEGPDVLLRQTSFRALSEPRRFREPDGSVRDGELRVRFGEVEARGVALTPAGRDLYDRLVAAVDERTAARPDDDRQDVAAEVWREGMPRTERELAERELAFFTYRVRENGPAGPPPATASAADLITGGWVEPEPIVYEDFLPRSAAGIFASNLSGAGHLDTDEGGTDRDLAWLSGAVDREIHVPEELYRAESEASLAAALAELGTTPRPSSPA